MIDINNIRKLTEAYANVLSDIDNAMLFFMPKNIQVDDLIIFVENFHSLMQ